MPGWHLPSGLWHIVSSARIEGVKKAPAMLTGWITAQKTIARVNVGWA
jgi:hypothetical protein